MSEKEESGQAGDPPLRKVDPAPSGSGLLGRITIANRQIQIQIEYSPGPPPRITGVAALAGKILSRHVFNLENILDPHTKQEIMTNCAHVFSNLFRERLISKARERIAANQRAISAQTSDSESAAAENKILEWPVNAASTPFLQTDSQPVFQLLEVLVQNPIEDGLFDIRIVDFFHISGG